MTNEDQDAIVGRTVRQLRDVKEKLAKLKSKAHLLGDAFNTVSYHFQNKPELLRFEREDTDTRFIERREDWIAEILNPIFRPRMTLTSPKSSLFATK